MGHILIFEEYKEKLYQLVRLSFDEIKHELIGFNEYQRLLKIIDNFNLGSEPLYLKYNSIFNKTVDHGSRLIGIRLILPFIVPKRDIEFDEDDYIISANIERSEDEYYYVRFHTNNSTYYRYKCDGIEGVEQLLDCFK